MICARHHSPPSNVCHESDGALHFLCPLSPTPKNQEASEDAEVLDLQGSQGAANQSISIQCFDTVSNDLEYKGLI